MKMLVTSHEIREALSDIKPKQVAVAYVGSGWSKFVNANRLKEIRVSPTLGSNPKAIEELMNAIGYENVYFLDELHAKIYLDKNAAVIGSCNLSDNAMGDGGLLECAVLIDESEHIKTPHDTFDGYKNVAKEKYPTRKEKIEKLRKLLKDSDAVAWNVSMGAEENPPTLADYKSELDTIHIVP